MFMGDFETLPGVAEQKEPGRQQLRMLAASNRKDARANDRDRVQPELVVLRRISRAGDASVLAHLHQAVANYVSPRHRRERRMRIRFHRAIFTKFPEPTTG